MQTQEKFKIAPITVLKPHKSHIWSHSVHPGCEETRDSRSYLGHNLYTDTHSHPLLQQVIKHYVNKPIHYFVFPCYFVVLQAKPPSPSELEGESYRTFVERYVSMVQKCVCPSEE